MTPRGKSEPLIDGEALADLPTFVALPLADFSRERHPVLRLWLASDAIEMLLRLAVMLELADLLGRGPLDGDVLGRIRPDIEEPTLGKWQHIAETLVTVRRPDPLVPELAAFVHGPLRDLLDGPAAAKAGDPAFISFRMLRNRIAHGAGVTRKLAARLERKWTPRLREVLRSADWLRDLFVVVRGVDSDFRLMRGPTTRPRDWSPDLVQMVQLQRVFARDCEVVVLRGSRGVALWPLAFFGPAQPPGTDSNAASASTPQVYSRRGDLTLLFTPVGSDEVSVSEGDHTSLEAFLHIFQAASQQAPARVEVRGFEEEFSRDAGRALGRNAEVDTLDQIGRESPDGVLWVGGVAGIGKSYLIARVVQRWGDRPPPKMVLVAWRFKAGDDRCSRDSFLRFAVDRFDARKN